MGPMRVRNSEVEATHEPESGFVVDQQLLQRRFMGPIRVRNSEVETLHELDPHPACGHPLPSDPGYAGGFAEASGRGAGGECSFSVEVHGPNSRAHDVQVKSTQEAESSWAQAASASAFS